MRKEGKILGRQDILNMQDMVTEEVWVEQWGGYVIVKSLTGKERDRFERSIVEIRGSGTKSRAEVKDNVRAKLIALAVVDAEGNTVFEPSDIDALGSKSAAALDTIFEVAQRLSKMTERDVDELVGN